MTATVLAGLLAEAVAKDELPENGGCDISAGLFGPHASQVLREAASLMVAPPSLAAERDAYKWGYEYLQSRMESLHRYGWAHDCDSEIEARIAAAGAAS